MTDQRDALREVLMLNEDKLAATRRERDECLRMQERLAASVERRYETIRALHADRDRLRAALAEVMAAQPQFVSNPDRWEAAKEQARAALAGGEA